MTTIISTHPWKDSFNTAILNEIRAKFDSQSKPYHLIDLPKDNFNPILTEADLEVYSAGKYVDPLVEKYQKILSETDELVFIFPIWWGTMPASLKGFFDKVLILNFAFNYVNGWTPLLDYIKKATVITTSASPTSNFKSAIEDFFVPYMLKPVGITNVEWLNCDKTSDRDDIEPRHSFLKQVADRF